MGIVALVVVCGVGKARAIFVAVLRHVTRAVERDILQIAQKNEKDVLVCSFVPNFCSLRI